MIALRHIDTCLSCYLTDHHNRAGELLLGVPVDGKSRNGELYRWLIDEFNAVTREDVAVTAEQFRKALDECFKDVDKRRSFDKSLDTSTSDEELDDVCQAWFLLTWDVEG